MNATTDTDVDASTDADAVPGDAPTRTSTAVAAGAALLLVGVLLSRVGDALVPALVGIGSVRIIGRVHRAAASGGGKGHPLICDTVLTRFGVVRGSHRAATKMRGETVPKQNGGRSSNQACKINSFAH